MQILFAVTLFTSAALLFLVQPMFAKMVLPRLGGTPAVWNACMVFYQAVLLAGYAYAHVATRLLGPRRQALLHLLLLCAPWLVLPIAAAQSWTPPAQSNPLLWLLLLLTVSVGLPFFVVSAGAPMLQAWFAATGHRSARDPYFLYAASNLGSMLALVGYPVLVEPMLPLAAQSLVWTVGYGLLMLLCLACAIALWSSPRQTPVTPGDEPPEAAAAPAVPGARAATLRIRLRWLALATAPSSLLLGVTTHISTDISSVPLLWVIPLALYLLTFVLVFARWSILPHRWMVRVEPILVLTLTAWFFLEWGRLTWLILPLHLATFFVIALVCHGELAASRPPARQLTEFYLWMSAGGVLGGLFNAILAPLLFKTVAEYPLMIIVACLLRPTLRAAASRPARQVHLPRLPRVAWRLPAWERSWTYWLDAVAPVLLAGGMGLAAGLTEYWYGGSASKLTAGILLGITAMVALSFADRPVRFGLGVAAVMFVGLLVTWDSNPVLCRQRSFFGVLRVSHDSAHNWNRLVHGMINHGVQSLDAADREEPLTYYHRTGPLGQIMAALADSRPPHTIGVIGLGTGTVAAYGQPGQQLTFYEIDPTVRDIAENTRYFTYLRDCRARGAEVGVVLGDARLTLSGARPFCYDLLVLDAYSSDAIPIHLATREAMELYLQKLAPDGVLALHISNRYFNLVPVFGRLVEAAGLVARVQTDTVEAGSDEEKQGKLTSHWIVVARSEELLGEIPHDARWEPIVLGAHAPLWTDDFSDVIRVLTIW